MHLPTRVQDADGPIRNTDNDAALARLSAVRKGYLEDPFIHHLVPRAHLQPPRPPLINVGTYVRSRGIDDLINEWFESSNDRRCQIISLGAGSDTRFWRIATGKHSEKLASYIELDFPEITSKKIMSIRKSKDLGSILGNSSEVYSSHGGTGLHSPKYHLLPVDLRRAPSEILENLLGSTTADLSHPPILSHSLPTLLLFECVLVYMSPESSQYLLRWFVDYFTKEPSDGHGGVLGCIIYEMFRLNDPFGRVMLNNLKTRNVLLPGAEPYPTIDSLSTRFIDAGFKAARALTLREIRREYIEPSELKRISKLELLDEIEELELVLDHYAISWGLFLSQDKLSATWGQWGLKPKMENKVQ